jgi:ADP-ribosylglycohydrolase
LETHIEKSFDEADEHIGTSGLATHVVPLALFSFLKEPRDFVKLMTQTINCGGDTDSRAALAGSLYGAYNGFSKIPLKYYINLKDNVKFLRIADQFSALINK